MEKHCFHNFFKASKQNSQYLTLLPGNVWLVPELGRILNKLDIQPAFRTSICNETIMSWHVPCENQSKALKHNMNNALKKPCHMQKVTRPTWYVEPWEVWEGVEVAGSATSTCWRPYPSIHCAIRDHSIGFITTGHAPFFWKLRLEARGRASLAESHTHSHYSVILVRWDREGWSGWSLITRWTALSWQVPMSLIWSCVATVHGVTVQTGASLGYM